MKKIRIPGYVPIETHYASLLGMQAGWIIGTVLYHWLAR